MGFHLSVKYFRFSGPYDLPNWTKVDGSLIEYQIAIGIQVCSSCSFGSEGEFGAIVQTEFSGNP